ncbi:MAG: hypothetical protein ACFFAE_19710 [Candidatus Hodarchaeota archaeon]
MALAIRASIIVNTLPDFWLLLYALFASFKPSVIAHLPLVSPFLPVFLSFLMLFQDLLCKEDLQLVVIQESAHGQYIGFFSSLSGHAWIGKAG